MDRKTEAQLRQELADVWALLEAERAGRAAAVAAERERIERDVADLHMTQATNNQNCPRAWHDGIDAALEVIRGA